MEKILVATDASENSRRAFQTALELARKFNAEVELLYVIEVYIPSSSPSITGYAISQNENEKEGELCLEATLEGIDINGVKLTKKKLEGKPWKVILNEIEDKDIDLVVMGSHGYGVVAGSLLGSVSRKVLHEAKCSVLIVK